MPVESTVNGGSQLPAFGPCVDGEADERAGAGAGGVLPLGRVVDEAPDAARRSGALAIGLAVVMTERLAPATDAAGSLVATALATPLATAEGSGAASRVPRLALALSTRPIAANETTTAT